ncbi:pyocin knob domain-containing protein [Comamonas sp. AG1104]|uniref:pyocin knob domain-containing protein n=1 Tax=Comamonas sp. AG1104 TaxID=2183900 RepID=UPI000E2B9CF1|nr:pyocin knob domain-containing protein [Comamonas sp. AG1104]RDI10972.1 hypothetical protein DFO48_105488 [Comamonas sp. AG1104]
MALEPINYGAAANDGTGDNLREAMRKSQANFVYLDQGKVDKVAGMGLSSNNFTNDERVKLENIQALATKNLADAVLLERSNHTGGFNGFGIANPMRNHDPVPFGLPPSAFFNKGSCVGLAHGSEVGIPEMGFGICRVDAQWLDATAGYGVMRSFESTDSRRYTCYATGADTWSPWRETTHRTNMYGTQPLSTISDAGTAASRNVQSSQVDVTAGHLMAVGAFGLGKPTIVGNMDMNAITQYPTGVSHYYVNNASNGPYVSFYGYLTVERIDDVYMIQTCRAVGEGTSFKRVTNNGVKGPWDKVIDTTSAVGAIASGSIIERGSNANGEYVKFAGGSQFCFASRRPTFANSSNLLFQWTFPSPFIYAPNVVVNEVGGDLAVAKAHLTTAYSIDSNGAAVSCLSTQLFVASDINSVALQPIAIGSWK